jgi:hypothetical protein
VTNRGEQQHSINSSCMESAMTPGPQTTIQVSVVTRRSPVAILLLGHYILGEEKVPCYVGWSIQRSYDFRRPIVKSFTLDDN